jgi:hypothetical protein
LQQQHRRQQQQQQARLQRPSPPTQQHTQVEPQYGHGASSSPLPVSYPVSRTERLQQLAQPKAMQQQKYDQVRPWL